jgi:hypothetical protein
LAAIDSRLEPGSSEARPSTTESTQVPWIALFSTLIGVVVLWDALVRFGRLARLDGPVPAISAAIGKNVLDVPVYLLLGWVAVRLVASEGWRRTRSGAELACALVVGVPVGRALALFLSWAFDG